MGLLQDLRKSLKTDSGRALSGKIPKNAKVNRGGPRKKRKKAAKKAPDTAIPSSIWDMYCD